MYSCSSVGRLVIWDGVGCSTLVDASGMSAPDAEAGFRRNLRRIARAYRKRLSASRSVTSLSSLFRWSTRASSLSLSCQQMQPERGSSLADVSLLSSGSGSARPLVYSSSFIRVKLCRCIVQTTARRLRSPSLFPLARRARR